MSEQAHRYVIGVSDDQWALCRICGLAEAAHERAQGVFTPTATSKRCPDCVTAEIDPCPHV